MKLLLKHLFLIACLLASVLSHAQIDYFKKYTVNGLSLNAGYTFGDFTKGYKFSSHGNVLERKFISYGDYYTGNWDWHVKMQYRFKKKYAIEAGVVRSQVDFSFADKAFSATLSDANYIGGFDFVQNYIAPSLSATYFLSYPGGEHLLGLYFTGGVNFNINMNKPWTAPAPFYTNTAQQHVSATNEELNFNIQTKSFFMQYYLESGINFCLYRCNLYLGAKYSFSQNMMTGSYQHLENGNITYSDQVHSPCNYFCATVRIGYILFQDWDKEKTPRHKKEHYKKGPKLKTIYIEPKY
ncbi:hypothetical protein [Cytophaga aurantiaca]|uniref:hypothetical protein n=1 Tax=Cytophaga aurantiaca TaxID=29530 RepID=UPI00037A4BC4|nr:hypothetical protein [Cytophaga aurantiaca]